MQNPTVSARANERPEPRLGVLGSAVFSAALYGGALYGMALQLPVLVPFMFVSPFPLMVTRLRSGLLAAVSGSIFAAALIGAVSVPSQSVGYLLLLAPVLLIPEAMARGRGIVRGCGWAFALLVAQVATALLFAHPSMEALALASIENMRSPAYVAELSAAWPPERVEAWVEGVNATYNAMSIVYPAAYVIMAALFVLLNAALLRGYLVRRDPGWLDGGEFERVRWPFATAVAFVLAGIAVLFPPLRPSAYNVLLVVSFFFALQGLAVVAFYAFRLAAPPFLRWAVLLLVVMNPWAPQILAAIGLFDTWFDFRKWAEPPDPKRA
ncbi:MAG TPA: DUF2232 domain-containing protein [Vicinamibacteria bacterium]